MQNKQINAISDAPYLLMEVDENDIQGIIKYASLDFFRKPRMRPMMRGNIFHCYEIHRGACHYIGAHAKSPEEAYHTYMRYKTQGKNAG